MILTVLPPLALYIHIPWCVRKCLYCDFNSHQIPESPLPTADYLQALLTDMQQEIRNIQGRVIETVFIGGGTPSVLPPSFYAELLQAIHRLTPLAANAEITLEANPGTVDAKGFIGFRASGINRLSLGVQSFDAKQLQQLGRIHDSQQVLNAVDAIHQADFKTWNIDLMFGLPGQSVDGAVDDLQSAFACESTHLSWYQLTVEPNTYFYRHPPVLPLEGVLDDIQTAGQQALKQHGFDQYEISAYAKAGHACRHNQHYWQYSDYVGIGAGAHSKITRLSDQAGDHGIEIVRYQKTRLPADYLRRFNSARIQIQESVSEQIIAPDERPFEFMMNALRLKEGVALDLFPARAGLSWQSIAKPMRRAESLGLLMRDAHTIKATALGYQHLNTLLECFLPSR